ncbi:MAG: hypothetical protein IKB30_03855 [Clostridia bacterium]|nr:hypothetical protein [Clostridia bacterium]
MKRFLSIFFALFLILSCFAVSGCQTESKSVLTYNKKYIITIDFEKDESKQNYWIFYDDGTCIYHNYEIIYGDKRSNYVCTFKYTLAEDKSTLFYFFDSVSYLEHNNNFNLSTSNSGYLIVSKDVVMNKDGSFFVCEEFIDNIPNYGK